MSESQYNELMSAIGSVVEATGLFSNRVDAGFAAVAARFDGIDTRLDGIDTRLDGIDGRLDGMDGRLDGMDGRLDRLERRVTNVEDTFTLGFRELNQRVGRLERASL
jgi:tetrahydromethanopterin S-methyltransferase subunit G